MSTLSLWYLQSNSELTFSGDSGDTEAKGPSRRYGIEWASFYKPTGWLTLSADFAFAHARYTEPAGGRRRPVGDLHRQLDSRWSSRPRRSSRRHGGSSAACGCATSARSRSSRTTRERQPASTIVNALVGLSLQPLRAQHRAPEPVRLARRRHRLLLHVAPSRCAARLPRAGCGACRGRQRLPRSSGRAFPGARQLDGPLLMRRARRMRLTLSVLAATARARRAVRRRGDRSFARACGSLSSRLAVEVEVGRPQAGSDRRHVARLGGSRALAQFGSGACATAHRSSLSRNRRWSAVRRRRRRQIRPPSSMRPRARGRAVGLVVASPAGAAAVRASGAAAQGGGGVVSAKPRYRSNPTPDYPIPSRRRREEGIVLLNVQVQVDGTPAAVSLNRSCGHPLLDRAALDAVRRWTFEPARAAGVPVSSLVVIPVRFSLAELP